MKKSIVITTIFDPSEAIELYSKIDGVELIVIGDAKSPPDWNCDGADYYSLERQKELKSTLAATLPHNHYCRKMLGYLVAIRGDADIVIDTDDDNLPKSNWGFPNFDGTFDTITTDAEFVNIYQRFTKMPIWPRGLPLDLIKISFDLDDCTSKRESTIGVWQGLADDDPDVDAIYRLVSDQPCVFHEQDPVVLAPGTVSPFNSQNTAFRRELFPLLYLPAFVTFRFTDILRGLVAQPIMWNAGYSLGFTSATVTQERNPHDLMRDFQSEIPMYLHCRDVVDIVSGSISASDSIESNLHRSYVNLASQKIVEEKELRMLENWLNDLNSN